MRNLSVCLYQLSHKASVCGSSRGFWAKLGTSARG
jgi:hypothetical protein